MEITSGTKEKLVPGKWKNQRKKEAKKIPDEDKKERGRYGCLMLPVQKENYSEGKEGELDKGKQMAITAKGFKSIKNIKQNKKENEPNGERKVITDGKVRNGGVKRKQKTPSEEDFKEDCRKTNAMGTDRGGLLLQRGKAGKKQEEKCKMHSHQGLEESGKKEKAEAERVVGKKEGCRHVGTHLRAGRKGQSKANQRENSDRDRKVPCITKQILPDAQPYDRFQGFLDTSLEHCLEDAQMVLSEVEGLQAKVESSHDRSKESKKEKFPRERKEATVQKSEAKKEYKDKLEEHTEDEYDLWVQCSISSCKKWRRLDKHVDLSVLPPEWTCVQSSDPDCCNCNCPEETWSGSQDDVVHSNLVSGSLVWAQQQGYPWWPAMTESDPDSKSIFLVNNIDRFPSKYHVTFFGDPVTRAWVPSCKVKSFETFSETTALQMGKSFKKKLHEAIRMAKHAQGLSLKSRLSRFGFKSRYMVDRDTSKEDNEISELMPIFEHLEESKQFWSNKGRIGRTRRNIKKKTSKEHTTVPHGESLEQGAGGGAEEGKEKAPISSVPRPDTHRKGTSTVYQLKTYSQTSNRS
ncbi:zinc finger CW-type PWWP domain protein 1-like isoform X2 [Brienomyrus brachyistius]|uniref:zinc finger CW-type PWWP domain protein 1-like isoform X2 n=1 Tax=Brienomyrus brachyistius TaxID=42636 RepID=UPI0020B3AABD|nr:zinc finger CW-type PWWP domain protein 1-like isoform X2 [Brienomyrus brachyistius]